MKLADYRQIAPALNADLRAAFAKHGLAMGKLSARVDELDGTVRYTIIADDMCLTDSDGRATTAEAQRYAAHHEMYNLQLEWLGQQFSIDQRSGALRFTVLGLLSTRSEKSVSVMVNGKKMRMSPDALRRAAGRVVRATPASDLIAKG